MRFKSCNRIRVFPFTRKTRRTLQLGTYLFSFAWRNEDHFLRLLLVVEFLWRYWKKSTFHREECSWAFRAISSCFVFAIFINSFDTFASNSVREIYRFILKDLQDSLLISEYGVSLDDVSCIWKTTALGKEKLCRKTKNQRKLDFRWFLVFHLQMSRKLRKILKMLIAHIFAPLEIFRIGAKICANRNLYLSLFIAHIFAPMKFELGRIYVQ